LGLIITILGAVATILLFGKSVFLAIITGVATLYQASSLNEMYKEKTGRQPPDRVQGLINMVATAIIIIMFIVALV